MNTTADPLWQRLDERLAAFQQSRIDPAVLNQKLADRARILRARMAGSVSAEPNVVLLAFSKGGQRFGVPIETVLEVQALDHLSPVPRTPSFILGVIHWRGAILALFDIGAIMGVAETGIADVHVAIVIEAAGRRIAVAALEVEDILQVPASQIGSAPTMGSVPGEWVVGICAQDRIVLRMDAIVKDAAGRLGNPPHSE